MRVLNTAGRTALPVLAATLAVGLISAPAWAGTGQSGAPEATPATVTSQQAGPLPSERRFHQRFRSQAQCIAYANHDHNPRTSGWDCRQGRDRNNPWEYWS